MAQIIRQGDLFTIGHSNHHIETFINYLLRWGIQGLVDCRSEPTSPHLPQYDKQPLLSICKSARIRYATRPVLGENSTTDTRSETFINEMTALCVLSDSHRVALMGRSKDPIDCHRARRLSAWLLTNTGRDVHHIHPSGLISGTGVQARLLGQNRVAV